MSGRDFWSRRRAAVEAETAAEVTERDAVAEAEATAELEARADAEILTELNLADPDTLETPDAIRDFLTHTLPARLKARALRRLWRLNPVLANLDGLIEYGEDYTDSATVVENLQTAYQVGKGMMRHVEELARKAEALARVDDEVSEEDENAQDASADPADVVADVEILDQVRDGADAVPEVATYTPEDDMPTAAPRPRRMTFSFEEQRT